jgi:hypothetical protein
MMTVAELIEKLQSMPQDRRVIVVGEADGEPTDRPVVTQVKPEEHGLGDMPDRTVVLISGDDWVSY